METCCICNECLEGKKQFYLMNTMKGKERYLCSECEEQLYTLTNFQRRKFVPKAMKYMRERLGAVKDLEIKTYVAFTMERRKMRTPTFCGDEYETTFANFL